MKARTLWLVGGSVALLMVVQLGLWWAVRSTVTAWHAAQQYDDHVRVLEQRVATRDHELTKQQSLINQLTTLMPEPTQKSLVVEQLERLAVERRVTPTIVSLTEESVKDQVLPLVVTVSVSGTPVALLNYLAAVEQLPQVNQIRQWSVSLLPTPTMVLHIVFYLQAV